MYFTENEFNCLIKVKKKVFPAFVLELHLGWCTTRKRSDDNMTTTAATERQHMGCSGTVDFTVSSDR